jgi:hypothetical protein
MDAVRVALLREVLAGAQWPSATRRFATVLSLDGGDPEVHGLTHEALIVAGSAEVDIDTVQHLVSAAAGGTAYPHSAGGAACRTGSRASPTS